VIDIRLPERRREVEFVLAFFDDDDEPAEPRFAAKRQESIRWASTGQVKQKKGTWTSTINIWQAQRFAGPGTAAASGRRFLESEHAQEREVRHLYLVEVEVVERFRVVKPVLPSNASVVDQVAALDQLDRIRDADDQPREDLD